MPVPVIFIRYSTDYKSEKERETERDREAKRERERKTKKQKKLIFDPFFVKI